MRALIPQDGGGSVRLGRAALEFARGPDGRTFLARQFAGYPFHVTRPFRLDPVAAPDLTTLYLQSASGGLYGGDDLHLSVASAPATAAEVTSQASTVIHDGRGAPARFEVSLAPGEGGFLAWWPDPAILLPGAWLRQAVSVRMAAGATCLCADAFLTHDPAGADRTFARLESDLLVDAEDGRRLLADRQHVDGTDWSVALGGRFKAAGSAVALGAAASSLTPAALDAAVALPGIAGGATRLPNGAGLGVRLLAADGAALSAALRALWETLFTAHFGAAPAQRRK